MLIACYYIRLAPATEARALFEYLNDHEQIGHLIRERTAAYSKLFVSSMSINAYLFLIEDTLLLAIESRTDDHKEIIVPFNHALEQANSPQFTELKFSNAHFRRWIEKSTQILECNILFAGVDTKLIGGNLKKSEEFLERVRQSDITRMVFVLDGKEDFLVTARRPGKLVLTPNPDLARLMSLLSTLLNPVEVLQA